MEKWLFQ